jgi:hypothetical protein
MMAAAHNPSAVRVTNFNMLASSLFWSGAVRAQPKTARADIPSPDRWR